MMHHSNLRIKKYARVAFQSSSSRCLQYFHDHSLQNATVNYSACLSPDNMTSSSPQHPASVSLACSSTCSSPSIAHHRFYEDQVLLKEEAMRHLLEQMEAQFAKVLLFLIPHSGP